jgi:hypothetical protein
MSNKHLMVLTRKTGNYKDGSLLWLYSHRDSRQGRIMIPRSMEAAKM